MSRTIFGQPKDLLLAAQAVMNKEAVNEEQDLTEISKKTLGSYIKAASDDRTLNALNYGELSGFTIDAKNKSNRQNKLISKISKRKQGISTAIKKLTKEEVLDEAYKGKNPEHVKSVYSGNSSKGAAYLTLNNGEKHIAHAKDNNREMPKVGTHISKYKTTKVDNWPTNEDVEQIDELSKSTLSSYIDKAAIDMADKKKAVYTAGFKPKGVKKKDYETNLAKFRNRARGIDQAGKKVLEDVEQIDEAEYIVMKKQRIEGAHAHQTGKGRHHNPYKEGSNAASEWAKGFTASSDGKGTGLKIREKNSDIRKEDVEQIDEAEIYAGHTIRTPKGKTLEIGKRYHYTLGGKKYSGEVKFSGERDYLSRQSHAGGHHIKLRSHFTDFHKIHSIDENVLEDVEQIDEISRDKLHDYMAAADRDERRHSNAADASTIDWKKKAHQEVSDKRLKGLSLAIRKYGEKVRRIGAMRKGD